MSRLLIFIEREARILIVTLLTLAVTCVSLFFFFDDAEEDSLGSIPVAQLSLAKSNVKRKRSNKFSWSSIELASPLYLKDSIKTGPEGSATISTIKGTSIELGENSLFILSNVDDPSLSYLRGTVVLRSLAGDKKITVDDNGERKVLDLPLRWKKPESKQIFILADGNTQSVPFEWAVLNTKELDSEAVLDLEISTSAKFKNSSVIPLKSSALSYTSELPVGKYYYRFISTAEKIVLTETRSFEIKKFEPLELLGARSSSEVLSLSGAASAQIAWSPRLEDSLVTHQLEISSDENFTKFIKIQNVFPETGFSKIDNIQAGEYFVRLVSRFKNKNFYSTTHILNVRFAKEIPLVLLHPPKSSSFEIPKELSFTWENGVEVFGDLRYEIEVKSEDSKSSFKEIRESVYNSNGFVWKNPQLGSYQWKVIAYSNNKKVAETDSSEFNLYRIFPFSLKSPLAHQEFTYWNERPRIVFEWAGGKAIEELGFKYLLEISKDPNFVKKVISEKLEVEHFELHAKKLTDGKYFWRIMTLDDFGKALRVSQVLDFTLGVHSELEAPQLEGIAQNEILNLMELDKLPTLQWNKVENATAYEVKVFPLKSRKPASTAMRESLKKTTYTLAALDDGEYSVYVQAVDPLKRLGKPSNEIRFVVTQGKVLKAPKLKKVEIAE